MSQKLKILFHGAITGTASAQQLYQPPIGAQAEILTMIAALDFAATAATVVDLHVGINNDGTSTFSSTDLICHQVVTHTESCYRLFYPGAGIPLNRKNSIGAIANATGSATLVIIGTETII